jgi:hypothetical protein
MGDQDSSLPARRLLFMAPAALLASLTGTGLLTAQQSHLPDPGSEGPVVLPNGKKQQDEILKADYEKDLKDARDLIDLAKSFELDLEKDERFVLSVSSLKKLDDMEKITKRLRTRLKRL